MGNETRTWYPSAEHSIADTSSGSNTGNGKDDHAPVGLSTSGWTWRELIKFAHDWSGWTGAKFVKAEMKVKTSTQVHLAFGGTPRCNVGRLQAAFDATHTGGGENSWGTTYGTVWPGPSTTAGTDMPAHTDSESTIVTWDVSDQFEALLPTNTFKRDGSPGFGATNYGFRIKSYDESSTARVTEFSSMRGAYQPRLVVTMYVEATPGAPTLGEPTGSKSGQQTTFNATATAEPSKYDVQVATDDAFTTLLWDASGLTTGITGTAIAATYAGSAQPSGAPIYWRVRTANSLGVYGPWSSTSSFSITSKPVLTITSPIDGALADIWNLGEAVEWADAGLHAKPTVVVAYSHPEGIAATNIRLTHWDDDYTDAAVTDFPGTYVSGQSYTLQVPRAWARNTWFRVEGYATAAGINGDASPRKRARMQWGQGIYTTPIGAATSDWRFNQGSLVGAGSKVAYLFRGRGGTTGSWRTSIGAVTKNDNLDVLVRLSTTSANPALADMEALWSASVEPSPDHWAIVNGTLTLDSSFRRFGVKSMKVVTVAGSSCRLSAGLDGEALLVSGSTEYTWSTHVHTLGQSLPDFVQLAVFDADWNLLHVAPTDGRGATKDSAGEREGWQRLFSTFTTPDGLDRIRPAILLGGGAEQEVRFDGHQLEEGAIASGWKPGNVGPAVVLDVGGVAVDATYGGSFRLRGSTGGLRDVVELGEHGLLIGGATDPVHLQSPLPNILQVGKGIYFDARLDPPDVEPIVPAGGMVFGYEQGRGPVLVLPNVAGDKNIRFDISWSANSIWTFDTNQAIADPGAGKVRLDKNSVAALSKVALSKTDKNGDLYPNIHMAFTVDGSIIINWLPNGRLDCFIAAITDHGTWVELDISNPVLTNDWGANGVDSRVYISSVSGGGGGGGSVGSPVVFAASRDEGTTQSIGSTVASLTQVTMTTPDVITDPDGFFDIANNRIVIPAGKAGWYMVTFEGEWAPNSTGGRRAAIRKNGANIIQSYAGTMANQPFTLPLSLVDHFSEGDIVEFYVAQNCGANLVLQEKAFSIRKQD